MKYRHLTISDRLNIEFYLERKMPHSFIAAALGVHRSTIHREVKRNNEFGMYHHGMAHVRSMKRKLRGRACHRKTKLKTQYYLKKHHLRRSWVHQQRYKDLRTFRDRLKKHLYRVRGLNRRHKREDYFKLLSHPLRLKLKRSTLKRRKFYLYPKHRERYYFRTPYTIQQKLIWKKSTPFLPPLAAPPPLSRPRPPVNRRPATITPSFRPLRSRASRKTGFVCPKTEPMQKIPHFPDPESFVLF